jgi:uncharacterized protein YlxW (UPF0749 family)
MEIEPKPASEREAELAKAQETIRQIEQAATEKAAEIERLEQAVSALEGREVVPSAGAFLLFVWTPNGYALHEQAGEIPAPGARLIVDDREHEVAKVAQSPLPGDARRCAYLEPV